MIVAITNGFINLEHVRKALFFTNRETKEKGLTLYYTNGNFDSIQGKDAEVLEKVLKHTALVDIQALLDRPFELTKPKQPIEPPAEPLESE